MIILLSPAKTLDYGSSEYPFHSEPRMLEQSNELVTVLKKKNTKAIMELMGVSQKIADLNVQRYSDFSMPFNTENAKPSVLAFKGDVYTGLKADEMNKKDLEFAQNHVRILSGLYGVLRPMDLMQPYRLEMGTKLKVKRKKNLYEFWDKSITQVLNEDLTATKGSAIINLASNEYFKSVKTKELQGDLYNLNFKEERNGVYKIISFNAKKARGMMANYIVKNKITQPEDLKGFLEDNYAFNEDLSTERDWIFTR